jgi:hypothetical protein
VSIDAKVGHDWQDGSTSMQFAFLNQRLAALKFISHCLTDNAEAEAVRRLRTEIHAGCLSWESVVGIANEHLLTPALWVALNNKGLAEEIPEDLGNYLRELHHLSKERNQHLQTQLLEAVKQLNSIGIVPVLLKGALHLVADLYGDSGIRIMTDIDLLVPKDELEKSLDVLHQLGYRGEDSEGIFDQHHHHCAPLFRPGDYGAMELHHDLLMKGFRQILPVEVALAQSEPLEFNGASMKVLSPTHRILHNILHSQLIDRHYPEGVLPFRSLHEVVTESNASRNRLDWSYIRKVMESNKRGNVLDSYLYMAHRLFKLPLPGGGRRKMRSLLYYTRCQMQTGWPWLDVWGHRIGRLSADNICRAYGCRRGWLPVNRARLYHIKSRLAAYRHDSKIGAFD